MIINIAEILACFAEVYIGFYFLNNFFGKKDNIQNKIKIIQIIFFTLLFSMDFIMTEIENYQILSMVIYCLIMFVYSVILLNEKIQYKVLMCIVNVIVNSIVIIFTFNLFSIITHKNIEMIMYEDNFTRISFLFATKFLYFILVSIILNFKNNKSKLTSSEWIVIFIIFLITYIALLLLWKLGVDLDLQHSPLIISISTALAITSVLVYFLLNKLSDNNYIREEYNLLKLKNQTEMKIYSEISSQYEELNCLKHDLKHHFSFIVNYINKNDKKNLLNYISKIISEYDLSTNNNIIYTENDIINLILNNKVYVAKQNNIIINFEINITNLEKITEYSDQIGVILANLLDNAIEAVANHKEKTIELEIYNVKRLLVISVNNPIDGDKVYDNTDFKTTKTDKKNHGFGLLSVKNIVDKCSGTFEITTTNGYFVANIVI
jgi:hypothetical protein